MLTSCQRLQAGAETLQLKYLQLAPATDGEVGNCLVLDEVKLAEYGKASLGPSCCGFGLVSKEEKWAIL